MPDPIPTVADAEGDLDQARRFLLRNIHSIRAGGPVYNINGDDLAAFRAAAREEGRDAERERCAGIAETKSGVPRFAAAYIAAAIRTGEQ